MRAISDRCVTFVSGWEGLWLTAKPDLLGIPTRGYGHTGADVVLGQKITKAQALADLRADLAIAADRLYARIGAACVEALTDSQYDALLSFVFNLGANPGWTIWKLLKAGKLDQVPAQMMRFINAGGRPVAGLANRRAAEVALWHEDDARAPSIPSSATRAMPTPPTPADVKPLAQSKTFWTGAATATSGAIAGATQVQALVAPHTGASEFLAKAGGALAVIIVGLGIAVMVFKWLDGRQAKR